MSDDDSKLQGIVRLAAQALERGELVALPTETVYGLGADAENAAAVAKIFALKGRPQTHPLIVHIADDKQLLHWAREVPDFAMGLIAKFWPGPLTLVFNKQPGVADACTGGQDTIALRCPAHPLALAVLREFKQGRGGIAAPSANKFGKVSPTTAAHVRDSFGHDLLVLDGGACEVGIESTIVDCSRPEIGAVLLRPGMVTAQALREALPANMPLILPVEGDDSTRPRVSGDLPAHYQPNTPVRIISNTSKIAGNQYYTNKSIRGLLALKSVPSHTHLATQVRVLGDEPHAFAKALYAALRELDGLGLEEILIEAPPRTEEWLAIHDRLLRAAHQG